MGRRGDGRDYGLDSSLKLVGQYLQVVNDL